MAWIKITTNLFPFSTKHTDWVIPPESDTYTSVPQITRILKLWICFSEKHRDMKDEQIQIWSRCARKLPNWVNYRILWPTIPSYTTTAKRKPAETFRGITYLLFCSCSYLEVSLCFELETHDYFNFCHCNPRYCSYLYHYSGRLLGRVPR